MMVVVEVTPLRALIKIRKKRKRRRGRERFEAVKGNQIARFAIFDSSPFLAFRSF